MQTKCSEECITPRGLPSPRPKIAPGSFSIRDARLPLGSPGLANARGRLSLAGYSGSTGKQLRAGGGKRVDKGGPCGSTNFMCKHLMPDLFMHAYGPGARRQLVKESQWCVMGSGSACVDMPLHTSARLRSWPCGLGTVLIRSALNSFLPPGVLGVTFRPGQRFAQLGQWKLHSAR